jgi:hypothetical protein
MTPSYHELLLRGECDTLAHVFMKRSPARGGEKVRSSHGSAGSPTAAWLDKLATGDKLAAGGVPTRKFGISNDGLKRPSSGT